jgi:hypothetical protein
MIPTENRLFVNPSGNYIHNGTRVILLAFQVSLVVSLGFSYYRQAAGLN